MTRMTLLVLMGLLLPATALAVPMQLAHQGELSDAGGPVTDTVEVIFELYTSDVGGVAVWSEVLSVDVVDGHYSTLLGGAGQSTPIAAVLAAEPALYLQLTIDGSPLVPRQSVGSAPYAIVADTAINVDGGVVNASSVAVNGAEVVDGGGAWTGGAGSIPWAAVTGAPADEDTLGGLSCSDGFVAKYDFGSGLWVCDTDLVLSSGDVLGMVGGSTLDFGTGSSMAGVGLATVDDLEWSLLGGVPLGFADDVDNDVLGDLGPLCADGDRASWSTSAGDWECAPEEVELDRLDTTGATGGDVLTFDGTDVAWEEPAAATNCVLVSTSGTFAELDCGGTSIRLTAEEEYIDLVTYKVRLRADGTPKCWGDPCPAGPFASIWGNDWFICGLDSAGTPTCWTLNGQSFNAPPAGTYSSIMCAGSGACCGIRTTGSLACWWYDPNLTTTGVLTGIPSGSFLDVGFVNNETACAVTTGGTVECWGDHAGYDTHKPSGYGFTHIGSGGQMCAAGPSGGSCWSGSGPTSSYVVPPGDYVQVVTSRGLLASGEVIGFSNGSPTSPVPFAVLDDDDGAYGITTDGRIMYVWGNLRPAP